MTVMSYASRLLLAGVSSPNNSDSAILAERGREGLFVFRSGDQSARVAADPRQAVYVAPLSDTTGSSGSWERALGASDPLNVLWFGATGDSAADDTGAVKSAVAYLKDRVSFYGQFDGQGELYFPPGVYRLTESGVLSHAENYRTGYVLRGSGEGSVIWLDPGAFDEEDSAWLYDNAGNTPETRGNGHIFENICFAGGKAWMAAPTLHEPPITNAGNLDPRTHGFRFSGPNLETEHRFLNCTFRSLNDVLAVGGSNNADTIRHANCIYQGCGRICYIDNPQSMAISFVQPSVGFGYGHFVEWAAGIAGAGNFSVYGGAIIQLADLSNDPNDMTDGANPSYVVKAVDGGPTTANAPVLFSGTRFELRDNCRLADVAASAGSIFTWSDCSILNTNTTDKEVFRLGGPYTQANLERCSIADQGGGSSVFTVNCPNGYGLGARLRIRDCTVPDDFHDKFVWANFGGVLQMSGCVGKFQPEFGEPRFVLYDCDLIRQEYGEQAGRTFPLKYAPISPQSAPNDLIGFTTQLPPRARIKAVRARILVGAGTAHTYRLRIGNDDRSVIYASSTTGPQNGGHLASADDLLINVGTNTNDRIVRLWADNGAGADPAPGTGTPAIEAVVEYY